MDAAGDKGDLGQVVLAFPDVGEADLLAELGCVDGELRGFAARYEKKVAELGAAGLADALRECESIVRPLQRATTFAEARLAANADDAAASDLLDHCDALWAQVAEHAEFLEREVAALADDRVTTLLADPDLAEYANHLRKVRAAADAQPPPAVAAAVARLDPTAGWERLARQLLGRITVAHEGRRIGLGEALPLLYDPSRKRRHGAADAVTAALLPEVELRATALGMLVRSRLARDPADRDPAGWCAAEHLANQVSAPEVSALLDIVRAERFLVHRFYRAKAELLGYPLTDADRYAPVGPPPGTLSWTAACDIVLAAFARLGGAVAEAARELLHRGAVDPVPRPGKRRGALTFGLPGGEAWVLVNFTGRPRDVLTLAHELGHAVHARLAGRHGPFNAAVPTALAETVGLFTESLAAEVYAEHADPGARTALLTRRVEDQLVAAFRQVALHDFEGRVYRTVHQGHLPDHDALATTWLAEQHALYGPAVALRDGYRHWWSYLDNLFFLPGSRFAYAYGQLAASALLARQRDDPAGFAARFADLLRAGASQPPAALLSALGLRLPEPSCWRAALADLHEQVDRFCRLVPTTPPLPDAPTPGGGEIPATTKRR